MFLSSDSILTPPFSNISAAKNYISKKKYRQTKSYRTSKWGHWQFKFFLQEKAPRATLICQQRVSSVGHLGFSLGRKIVIVAISSLNSRRRES